MNESNWNDNNASKQEEEEGVIRINLLQVAPSTRNIVKNINCVLIKRNIDLRWSEKRWSYYGAVQLKKKKKIAKGF